MADVAFQALEAHSATSVPLSNFNQFMVNTVKGLRPPLLIG